MKLVEVLENKYGNSIPMEKDASLLEKGFS